MGKITVNGAARQIAVPVAGIKVSSLAVGSIVKIKENNIPVEYIKVHQGVPSSLYDESCNGTWVLRKDCVEMRQMNSSDVNDIENSTIIPYLNKSFFNTIEAKTKIKDVKIPYRKGAGYSQTPIASGESGLPCKIFLLGGAECGCTNANTDNSTPVDGVKLDWFPPGSDANQKRISIFNGQAVFWATRSPCTQSGLGERTFLGFNIRGSWDALPASSNSNGIRPCFILNNTATVDDQGNLNN